MKVLIVGGGGREHALAWKIAQSPELKKLYCAPGNAGIARLADCINIDADDIDSLSNFARKERIDLTVVGPEKPLVKGIVDRFQANGLNVFGPSRKAAALEGSKVFSKTLMRKYGIPTAEFRSFKELDDARRYIGSQKRPPVIKADGLAAGKGAIVCNTQEEALEAAENIIEGKLFGEAGRRIVVEEFLEGEEVSVLAFTDGSTIVPLEAVQDHKALHDGDTGPNTGGMGAYSPVPAVTDELYRTIEKDILVPTVHAMKKEGSPYRGIIYVGLMLTSAGPKVLEYNVRFGDPETQPLLMRLKGDLLPTLFAVAKGKLETVDFGWDPRPSVCVVMASGGYPGKYEKGEEINGLDDVAGADDVVVFHAGTTVRQGKIVTNGGRVLGVTAVGADIRDAQKRAYDAVAKINFSGAYYRKDIGAKALHHAGIA
ncbi:MAG: phosphoribosylamine--glycine ligase [Candidatus Brocadiales bacterium]|nr:phosphoribosylamine--glycine ligase [Candidatus Bathyanammoxibius sp.]